MSTLNKMCTHICSQLSDLFCKDPDNLAEIIMDLERPSEERIQALLVCFSENQNRCIECLNTLMSQYQMSGIKNLEKFLRQLCEVTELPSYLRVKVVKALFAYEELEDDLDDFEEDEKDDVAENNRLVQERNRERTNRAADGLEFICKNFGNIPTPCRVEAVMLLLEQRDRLGPAIKALQDLTCDPNIDCDFRYKCILDLENLGAELIRKIFIDAFEDKNLVKKIYRYFSLEISREFPDYKPTETNLLFFKTILGHVSYSRLLAVFREYSPSRSHYYDQPIHDTLLCFLKTETNETSYRILAAQYLLQKYKPLFGLRDNIEKELVNFAEDQELDINLRADAADVLLQLGSDRVKIIGRDTILNLGIGEQKNATIFENSQNVHTEEIEASVTDVLEFFTDLPMLKINKVPINFTYVKNQVQLLIRKLLKRNEDNCTCKGKVFCSDECRKIYKIDIALNRIHLDRALYSKFNSTLVNILLKVWTYASSHEHKDEIHKRLLEELEEMSGTCSSGYASRLINVISGFGEFNIRISWADQIKANFSGRLTAAIKNIKSASSIFREEPYLTEMVMLCINEDHEADEKNSIKSGICAENPTYSPQEIVAEYLKNDRNPLINQCLDQLSESVLEEMLIPSSMPAKRKYFALCFRSHIPSIREELYKEFKGFMDDSSFDLYMRKALMNYDGAR